MSRRNDDSFAKSNKELICLALGVYSNDLVRTRQDMARQLITREPSPEQVQRILKMDDVEKQLKFIEDAMEKDWCEKY